MRELRDLPPRLGWGTTPSPTPTRVIFMHEKDIRLTKAVYRPPPVLSFAATEFITNRLVYFVRALLFPLRLARLGRDLIDTEYHGRPKNPRWGFAD